MIREQSPGLANLLTGTEWESPWKAALRPAWLASRGRVLITGQFQQPPVL